MKYFSLANTDILKQTFENKKFWLFDLDNTLYSPSCRLFDQVDRNITNYIIKYLELEWDEAYRLQKSFFKKYGTTLRGLMTEHGTNPNHYLECVHDIDLSPVNPNPELAKALAQLTGRKIIFTNGSVQHAENVMKRLGVHDHFETVFDIVASDFQPKPERIAYDKLVQEHAVYPPDSVMIEDMARNLKPAHEMGMTCVWVRNDNRWAYETAEGEHIDHIIDDLTLWLRDLTAVD